MSRDRIEAAYPLTPAQHGMLLESLAAPGSGIHVEQTVLELDGELDSAAFDAAWRAVAARQPLLRTAFVWRDQPEPVQAVLRTAELPVRREDWGDRAPGELDAALDELLAADRRDGFALSKAPLSRLILLRTGERRHLLVWSHHHLLLDGEGGPRVLADFAAAYRAAAAGEDPSLPPVRPYRDYVEWLGRRDPAAAEEHWRRALAGVDLPTPIGRAAAAPSAAEGAPARRWAEAEARVAGADLAALRELARRLRLTLNTLTQAAWGLLLARYGGAGEAVFGVTVSTRPPELEGLEETAGVFLATLPLRIAADPAAGLGDWLAGVQAANLDLRQHAHLPAGRLRRAAGVPGSRPLFESILVFENYPLAELAPGGEGAGGGLAIRPRRAHGAQTGYALTLLAMRAAGADGDELRLRLVHDARRLTAAGAARALEHLVRLLAAMPGEPAVGELAALVPDGEVPAVAPAELALAGRRRGAPPAPPRDPVEAELVRIWREVLGVDEVGVEDGFFELGGHSLTAAELIGRLRRRWGSGLPLRLLFEAPTIAELAPRLSAEAAPEPGAAEPGAADTAGAAAALVPDPASRHRPFPLTDVQEAYWIGRTGAFELGNVATHLYFEIEGERFDLGRCERAFARLIERHDMLRAVVGDDGLQRVLPRLAQFRIPVIDVSAGSAAAAGAAVESLRAEMSHQVLPADTGPLFDLRAVRRPGGAVRLHVSLDLLIGDAWSWSLLFRDWARFYRDPHLELPPLELSFRDCVLAARAAESGEGHRRAREYWRARLPTLPPGPALPLAVAPSEVVRPRFTARTGALEAAEWRRFQERAAAAGLTPTAALLAAFGEVLAAWSRGPRFTLNLTLFNRPAGHPEVGEIVGDFTSLTLLEVDAAPGAPFAERARRLQARFWEDLDHRAYGGVRVLRDLARGAGGPARALMPVVFTSTLHGTGGPGDGGAGGTDAAGDHPLAALGRIAYAIGQTPQVWLDHQVAERAGRLEYLWEAVEELFPAGLLDDLFAAWGRWLGRLAGSDEAWRETGAAHLVPPAQLELFRRVNATVAPRPEGLLHGPFFERAAREPERTAVIAGDRELSYGELARRARALARELRAAGARPDRPVAVVLEKGWRQAVAVLAALEAGAPYLPVDPALPAARVRLLLERGGVELALAAAEGLESIDWPAGVRALAVGDRGAEPAAGAGEPLAPLQGPDDLAYVIFTSGSTGEPKGVMIEHRAALNTIADVGRRFAVGPGDRALAVSSLSFDLSVYDLFGLWAAGGAAVLPEPGAGRDPGRWAELARAHRVTLWSSVPALASMLAEWLEGRGERLPPALRLVLLSGDWIPVGLPDRLRRLAAGELEVIGLGGATEASIWSILHPVGEVDPERPSIPYGRPMANQTFHVLDPGLAPRPVWVPGELYIGGAGLARGYWRDPERTAAAFVVHPESGERLYRTGDLGRWWPDGEIEFLGREDGQVKIRGHRIELGEIEAHLARHPEVAAAAVAAVGERRDDRRLVAYLVPRPGAGDGAAPAAPASRPALTGPAERYAFKRRRPGLRPLPGRDAIELPRPPGAADERMDLHLARRSHRRFLDRPVALDDLAGLLSCLMSVEVAGSPFAKYRYGSPGNLYPVQTYLHVRAGRVEGLNGGGWYYHPGEHRLVALAPGEIDRTVHPLGNREVFDRAAFSIFLVADLDATVPLYGELARHFAALEAGLMTQLLETSAAEHGLGLCQIGSLDFAPVRPLLDLGPSHLLLHSLVGGAAESGRAGVDAYLADLAAEAEIAGALAAAAPAGGDAARPSHPAPAPAAARAGTLSDRLREHLEERLPAAMVPSAFVLLERLPLSANGKVDRAALPPPEAVPVPAPAAASGPAAPAEPPSELEAALAEVWREVLEIDRVDLDQSFFDLGGNSVAMVRAYNRLRQRLGVELPLVAMFDRPTVRALAAYLAGQAGERATLSRGRRRGEARGALLAQRARERSAASAAGEGGAR